jgi:hypothetical protein
MQTKNIAAIIVLLLFFGCLFWTLDGAVGF